MNISSIYKNGQYLQKNPTWHIEDSAWKAQLIVKILEKNGLKPKTICEVGCGAGEILNQLHRVLSEDIEFYGYEISPQAYALCEQRVKERLSFNLKDLLEEENAYFDVALAIDVVEHIEDYFSFLRRFRSKAVYKIFHIPLDLSVQAILRRHALLNVREKLGHLHYFTDELVFAALKYTGYQIKDYFFTAGAVEIPGRSFKRNIAKIPRKVLYSIDEQFSARLFGGFSLMVLAI